MTAIPLEYEIEYPTSDGQPMAETPLHRSVTADLIFGLENRYADEPYVWVGGNFFLCYEERNPNAHVSPDVMVAKGAKKWMRPNYLLWEEVTPSFIIEVTSRWTRRQDEGDKKNLYAQLGVEELVLFDPLRDYLRPPLQGYELENGRYKPIPLNPDGSWLSRATGLLLKPEGNRLRLIDVVTGERLLWQEESEPARILAEKRAADAEERAAGAEERAAEEAAARQAAEARAVEEAAARQAAEARAVEEAAARRALEEQLQALQAKLNNQ